MSSVAAPLKKEGSNGSSTHHNKVIENHKKPLAIQKRLPNTI